MLLVGIVTGQRGIILGVNRGAADGADQGTGAGVVGQHNLGRIGRPLQGVAHDYRWPVNRLQALGGIRLVLAEPPDLKRVIARNGVDGNDGALIGGGKAAGERVHVSLMIIREAIRRSVGGKGAPRGKIGIDPARPIGAVGGAELTGGGRKPLADGGGLIDH